MTNEGRRRRNGAGALFARGLCICSVLLWAVGALAPLPAAGQQTTEPQTAPVTEPRAAAAEQSGPPVAKGKQAIKQHSEKCSQRLVVNAKALFAKGRWTLNPDANQTLDELGPMVAKAGKHPARIVSFIDTSGNGADNQSVAEKRAITVRGWLSNNGFVPTDTPAEGAGMSGAAETYSDRKGGWKERVEIIIDTCK